MMDLDKTWHLSYTDEEIKVTDFELQFWRVFYSFLRWQQKCENIVNGTNLIGQDLSVLHIIRMKDRPKTMNQIARLLNRDDNFNIQYSIKKLLKMGLIEKLKLQDNKQIAYSTTPEGIKNTDNMAKARKKILVGFINDAGLNLEETTQTLIKLRSIYDEAEHTAYSCLTRTK